MSKPYNCLKCNVVPVPTIRFICEKCEDELQDNLPNISKYRTETLERTVEGREQLVRLNKEKADHRVEKRLWLISSANLERFKSKSPYIRKQIQDLIREHYRCFQKQEVVLYVRVKDPFGQLEEFAFFLNEYLEDYLDLVEAGETDLEFKMSWEDIKLSAVITAFTQYQSPKGQYQ